MNKIKVKDSGSLYRDEESGAILNCSDSEYDNYLKLKQKKLQEANEMNKLKDCLLYTSPSPRDRPLSRMPSSA